MGLSLFFIANATTVLGLTLAVLIIRRVLSEKRTPSHSFAWFFIVIFFPLVGAVLYSMLGGLKSRKTTHIKLAIAQAANSLAADITLLEEWACNIIEHCIPYETAITDKQLMPAKLTESLVHLFVPLL